MLQVIIKDRESNSNLLTIQIYVLEHKCEQGICLGPDTDVDCHGIGRADGKNMTVNNMNQVQNI